MARPTLFTDGAFLQHVHGNSEIERTERITAAKGTFAVKDGEAINDALQRARKAAMLEAAGVKKTAKVVKLRKTS